jgi:hypothetical protein
MELVGLQNSHLLWGIFCIQEPLYPWSFKFLFVEWVFQGCLFFIWQTIPKCE